MELVVDEAAFFAAAEEVLQPAHRAARRLTLRKRRNQVSIQVRG